MADSSFDDAIGGELRRAASSPPWRLLAPVLVLVLAEATILLGYITVGLVLHAGLLLILLGVVATTPEHAHVYEVLTLVSLLRLLNLGTGILSFSPYLWLGGIYLLLLGSITLVMRNYDEGYADIGFSWETFHGQRWLAISGLVVGCALGGVQWVLDLEQPPAEPTLVNVILAVAVTGLLVGFVEEFLFRGLLQRWLSDLLDVRVSVLAVSVLFGFMHSVWLNPLDVAFAFSVSLLIGAVYARTRNFWFIMLVHAMINAMAFGVLPWLVGSSSVSVGLSTVLGGLA